MQPYCQDHYTSGQAKQSPDSRMELFTIRHLKEAFHHIQRSEAHDLKNVAPYKYLPP